MKYCVIRRGISDIQLFLSDTDNQWHISTIDDKSMQCDSLVRLESYLLFLDYQGYRIEQRVFDRLKKELEVDGKKAHTNRPVNVYKLTYEERAEYLKDLKIKRDGLARFISRVSNLQAMTRMKTAKVKDSSEVNKFVEKT